MGDSEPTDIYFRGLLPWRSGYCVGQACIWLVLTVPTLVSLVANARLLWADGSVGRVIVVVVLGTVAAGLSGALGLIVWRIAVGHIDHQEISAKGFQARLGVWSGFIPWERVRNVYLVRRYFSPRYDLYVAARTPRGFILAGTLRTEPGMPLDEAEALMDVILDHLPAGNDS
jgi:hypothetical protein